MNLTKISNWRYSTKEFNPNKKIKNEDFQELINVMRLSPSSVNSQPWHFIIANDDAGKNRIADVASKDFIFNESKMRTASHIVVFVARKELSENYLSNLLEKEDNDGRYVDIEQKNGMKNGREFFYNLHKETIGDANHWLEKQVYLNMGVLLLGAGAMGIDAVPMEGINIPLINEEFGLNEKGLTAVGIVSLGYRDENKDYNASLPKSRLDEKDIITWL